MGEISKSLFEQIIYAPVKCLDLRDFAPSLKPGRFKGDWRPQSKPNVVFLQQWLTEYSYDLMQCHVHGV